MSPKSSSRRFLLVVVAVSALGLGAVLLRKPLVAWFGGARGAGKSAPAAASEPNAADAEIDHYTCSMHPSVWSKTPGHCPICGMPLVPVLKKQQTETVVQIASERRQQIGVRTGPVVLAPMVDSIRAVGRLTYDESSLVDVNLKVSGWIAKLLVSKTGERVRKGQPLFTLYSPELQNAQQDFLLALHAQPLPGSSAQGGSLATATRQRLRLLDMTDVQIDAIAASGQPLAQVTFTAPAAGVVIEKDVVEGSAVEAGMRLFRIGSLSRVWIEADVYEADLPRVHIGQPASVTLDHLPDRSYDAAVAYVYPSLDPQTRTGKVRLELRNRELELRPGMYATVRLDSVLADRLQVPTSAVVYTGPRRLVFVDLGEGRFRAQEVQIGVEANGMYEVLSGLRAGDVVATSGVFLIAAEARIRNAAEYWDSSEAARLDPSAPGAAAAPSRDVPRAPVTPSAPRPNAPQVAPPATVHPPGHRTTSPAVPAGPPAAPPPPQAPPPPPASAPVHRHGF